jgi:eukaryotic-like serine/threonine-protein kinase
MSPPELSLRSGRRVVLDGVLDMGAGGTIWSLAGTSTLVAKVHHHRDGASWAHLRRMLERDPRDWREEPGGRWLLAWPLESLHDADGAAVGYVMPRLDEDHWRLGAVVSRADREDAGLDVTWRWTLRVAGWLALLVTRVHAAGIVIGDLSDANVLVHVDSGRAALVDCDAMRLPDEQPAADADERSPDTAAPERLRTGAAADAASDRFALAVCVCRLLMDGAHPFAGRISDRGPGGWLPMDNVRAGVSRFHRDPRLELPAGILPLAVLPRTIAALAERCFVAGDADPSCRPPAAAWARALARADGALVTCEHGHLHDADRRTCPWCEHARGELPTGARAG